MRSAPNDTYKAGQRIWVLRPEDGAHMVPRQYEVAAVGGMPHTTAIAAHPISGGNVTGDLCLLNTLRCAVYTDGLAAWQACDAVAQEHLEAWEKASERARMYIRAIGGRQARQRVGEAS